MCENLRGKKLKKRSHNQKGGIDSESEIVWHEKEFDYEFVSKGSFSILECEVRTARANPKPRTRLRTRTRALKIRERTNQIMNLEYERENFPS